MIRKRERLAREKLGFANDETASDFRDGKKNG